VLSVKEVKVENCNVGLRCLLNICFFIFQLMRYDKEVHHTYYIEI